ncbi:MAG: hypothetical protein EP343_14845 [Deltaproteobacteria bacterium]|nr:MAG: hypothetical protein EP343_14845 [Deltaproteobacteria bacterium]
MKEWFFSRAMLLSFCIGFAWLSTSHPADAAIKLRPDKVSGAQQVKNYWNGMMNALKRNATLVEQLQKAKAHKGKRKARVNTRTLELKVKQSVKELRDTWKKYQQAYRRYRRRRGGRSRRRGGRSRRQRGRKPKKKTVKKTIYRPTRGNPAFAKKCDKPCRQFKRMQKRMERLRKKHGWQF